MTDLPRIDPAGLSVATARRLGFGSTMKDASGTTDGGLSGDDRRAGPAVARMLLGARLRRLREDRGLSREQAGRTIRSSGSKLCRLELGRTGCKPRDVEDLLTLYGVVDAAERDTTMALAEQANTSGWWHPYQDVIPTWAQTYLGLEQASPLIRTYELQFVPGLLQTADYARAVTRLAHEDATGTELARRVELRMRRQRILHGSSPTRLWAVIDETALRRSIGGPAVMRAQVRHLIRMSELPHVTVQVLPFAAGGQVPVGGPVTLLRLPGGGLPDVVYLEQLTSAVYADRPGDLDYYRHVMNRLVTEAESVTASRALLEELAPSEAPA